MPRIALLILLFLLAGCSGAKVSRYAEGDLQTRTFKNLISQKHKIRRDHYIVKRNKQGQITSAKRVSGDGQLVEQSGYRYDRKGALISLRRTEYFFQGPPRVSRQWKYRHSKVFEREEKWFTRNRSLEKRITVYYDSEGKPFLEETWGLAKKIESSTEYYYDYKKRLDKSRRNFYNASGDLRDYWITLYNDDSQITHEEHYWADNSLIAFYRYSYHPSDVYREQEETFDEVEGRYIARHFDAYGKLLSEEERDREMIVLERREYDYSAKGKPLWVRHYNGQGKEINKTRYNKSRYLDRFRTPGL